MSDLSKELLSRADLIFGKIAGFDSFLRSAWYSDVKYPLSAALYASSSLKARLPAQVVVEGKVTLRRVFSGSV